mmetsp:Transcript_73183/g.226048  ORF Transcript_73183/g.226048 Transcript_73183/m.226048 type:complete len:245 (-) Transcript_73183:79-813(-)
MVSTASDSTDTRGGSAGVAWTAVSTFGGPSCASSSSVEGCRCPASSSCSASSKCGPASHPASANSAPSAAARGGGCSSGRVPSHACCATASSGPPAAGSAGADTTAAFPRRRRRVAREGPLSAVDTFSASPSAAAAVSSSDCLARLRMPLKRWMKRCSKRAASAASRPAQDDGRGWSRLAHFAGGCTERLALPALERTRSTMAGTSGLSAKRVPNIMPRGRSGRPPGSGTNSRAGTNTRPSKPA